MKIIIVLLALTCIGEFWYCINRDCCHTVIVPKDAMDYQIDLVPSVNYKIAPDSIEVWDGERKVGTVPILEDSPIGILIYQDNE